MQGTRPWDGREIIEGIESTDTRGHQTFDKVSPKSGVHCEPSTQYAPGNCRAVATIQEGVNERGRQSVLSRLAHSKSDKEAIAAWKQEIMRILQVFNVRSPGFV